MKFIMSAFIFGLCYNSFAVTWTYQVNINNSRGAVKKIDSGRNTFDAGPHNCEVTPVSVNNKTEYRSLICGADTVAVSTGGLCTQKGAKISSVQYAILNLSSPKNAVNVVVACKFD